jgi:hypothetical protein
MSGTTGPKLLTSLRYSYVSLVTTAVAFGTLDVSVLEQLLSGHSGAYAVIAVMTLYHLVHQSGDLRGRRLKLAYTITTLFLTVGNCYTSAKILEAFIIEYPAHSPQGNDVRSCAPVGIAGTVISIIQFLLSDALMVRLESSVSDSIL